MLTHGELRITLETRLGTGSVSIHPDHSSSSNPPRDIDIPEYWQLSLKNPQDVYSLAATLYNNHDKHRHLSSQRHLRYAVMEQEETCKVPQAEIDKLAAILNGLTGGRVFTQDEAIRL